MSGEVAVELRRGDDYTVQFTQFAPNDNFPDMLEIFGLQPGSGVGGSRRPRSRSRRASTSG